MASPSPATPVGGPAGSLGYRWSTEPGTRASHAPQDQEFLSRLHASHLREVVTRRGAGSPTTARTTAGPLGQGVRDGTAGPLLT